MIPMEGGGIPEATRDLFPSSSGRPQAYVIFKIEASDAGGTSDSYRGMNLRELVFFHAAGEIPSRGSIFATSSRCGEAIPGLTPVMDNIVRLVFQRDEVGSPWKTAICRKEMFFMP